MRYSLALLAGFVFVIPSQAGSWAEALFDATAKDFGTVPHGPVLTHPFRVTNTTTCPIHVAGLRVSCGCVQARMETTLLDPGKSTTIMVEMHTDRFLGDKAVNVYVLFDQPALQEVALEVKCRICDDVLVSPETLDFGRAPHGQARKVETLVSFPVGEQYQIQNVTSESEHVHVSATEMLTEQGQRVYQITATLDSDLGVGKWYTEVWLHTNHPGLERIRVPVRADVEAPLVITPACVKLDVPFPGQRVQHKVLVHGSAPFAILAVKGTDDHWSVQDDTPGRALRHVLTITLVNSTAGSQEHCFQVITDLPSDGMVQFHAQTCCGH